MRNEREERTGSAEAEDGSDEFKETFLRESMKFDERTRRRTLSFSSLRRF